MISIAIPCYEMGGYGDNFLEYSLSKIYSQTYKDIEVIISDHSRDNKIFEVYHKWKILLNLKYIRNELNRGSSSANTNMCIKYCGGDIIKILCQDDYIYDDYSIEKIVKAFEDNLDKMWLVGSYYHTYNRIDLFNLHTPSISSDIALINHIGTHSCLSFRNRDVELFDEILIWFMDSELYSRLFNKFGNPIFLKDITMVQTLWNGQVTNTVADQIVRDKEYLYIIEKR